MQPESNSTSPVGGLSIDERSALWYFGGYLIRKIQIKVKKGSQDEVLKNNVLSLLDFLLEDENNDEDEEDIDDKSSDDCKRWLDNINRGKLTICNNDFHTFLYSVLRASSKTDLQVWK